MAFYSTVIFLLILIIAPLLLLYLKIRRLQIRREKLPHLGVMSVFGNLDKTIGFPHSRFLKADPSHILQVSCGYSVLFRQEGMYGLFVGPIFYAVCFRADRVEKVLTSTTILDKSADYDLLHPWLKTGLLTSKGAKWKSRRKAITPTFHFRILEDFIPIFNEHSRVFVRRLQEECGKDPINIVPLTSMCTLDIIGETAMGIKLNAQCHSHSPFVSAIERLGAITILRAVRPWLRIDFLFKFSRYNKEQSQCLKVVHDFTRKVIEERKKEMVLKNGMLGKSCKTEDKELGIKKRQAFLDLLLNIYLTDGSLSEDDIQEEVDTFMFGGHDTTSTAINWVLYLLGLYPQIQEKVYEELQDVLGDDKDQYVTSNDIRNLKYLECVMKESQRLYPSVPFISRQATQDIDINNYTVPAGSIVSVLIYTLHRDPKVFPNPEVFDPDRFLDENINGLHPFAFIPFSAGPRNCIGQKFAVNEEKVILAHILRNFRITSADPRDALQLSPDVILRSIKGIRLCLEKRT